MTEHPLYDATVALLKEYGDLYSFDDIITNIREGKMQSFSRGETWVVTQVIEFPRRTVLDIVLLVGDFGDLRAMEPAVMEYAKSVGASILIGNGRYGWSRRNTGDWKPMGRTFYKEVV